MHSLTREFFCIIYSKLYGQVKILSSTIRLSRIFITLSFSSIDILTHFLTGSFSSLCEATLGPPKLGKRLFVIVFLAVLLWL
jgi:hypothetical protein